jgi:NADH dehydrogenase
MKHLAVIGGGFAGMWAALTAARELALADASCRVTVVSRDEFLTIRPRLYEVFTPKMRAPLAPVLTPLAIELLVGDVQQIDLSHRRLHVQSADGLTHKVHYDRLVLAAGSEQRALSIPGAREWGLDIDTYAAAEKFDSHLASVLKSPDEPGALTFVIVGGGFTGIELAAEMRTRIRAHADDATARRARIVLVERADAVGPDLGANPRPHVETALREARVELRLGCTLERIERDAAVLAGGERLAARSVVITAGLQASPLATALDLARDALGRVKVDAHLRVPGAGDVFAAGDIAHAQADATHLALMSCQHAVPMGKHAGYNAAHDMLGTPLREYSQPNYVTCLDLGEFGALFTLGWERKPEQVGPEVKALKQMVNTQWIYPPSGDRTAIMKAADLDAPWPPEV